MKHQFLWIFLKRAANISEEEGRSFAECIQKDYLKALYLLELDFLTTLTLAGVEVDDDTSNFFLPFHEGLYSLFIDLISQIHNASTGTTVAASGLPEAVLATITGKLKKKHLGSKNRKRTIQAMVQDDIPSLALTPQIFQIGWGKNARLLDSSVSDKTRSISAALASNKKVTSELLRIHGLPASEPVLCMNEKDALNAAKKIGFPVVIKPADRERGVGVYALIDNEERLLRAFSATSSVTDQVLLEKHFHGQDYRIQIFEGVAYSVTQRSPGGVTGDGRHTVKELLDMLNAERRHRSDLRQLALDDDARDMLTRQQMSPDSIPMARQFVSLRSVANVDRGGMSVQVIEKAHPDNLALAAKAAQVLELDIAGIDLLISDISKSWHDVGALICEVNSRPMINTAAIGRLLRMMSPSGYRIPSMLLVADLSMERLIQAAGKLHARVGIASPQGAWIDGMKVCKNASFVNNGRSILLNRELRIFIHCVTPEEMSSTEFFGFPCDRYDLAVIPRRSSASVAADKPSTAVARHAQLNFEKVSAKIIYTEDIGGDLVDWALKKLSEFD